MKKIGKVTYQRSQIFLHDTLLLKTKSSKVMYLKYCNLLVLVFQNIIHGEVVLVVT